MSQLKNIKRVLIANRGEIAVRIIRACQKMGLETVAIFSPDDAHGLHRYLADYAVPLTGTQLSETYLSLTALEKAITVAQADAVHPGYGFLSENAQFAELVENKLKKIFIGPKAATIAAMGDKVRARNIMAKAGVPIVPGSQNPIKKLEELKKLVHEIGLPVIIKASGGGGGRGMRVVTKLSDLEAAFQSCQREAQNYFGNPDVFCERFIQSARHIEFQVLCDEHGHGIHLFERDCSIQRRQQKLIEEAPSAFLDDAMRQQLGAIAVSAAQAINYRGVGTVEFICESPTKAYFMEMNTRIQVEHPVTEMITGIDLVEQQLRVADGQSLTLKQEEIRIHGWAIEARVTAEDPLRHFAPSLGPIKKLNIPNTPNTRVDTHIYEGYTPPRAFDSLLAKIICWGKDRHEALQNLRLALTSFSIQGIKTSAIFHEAMLNHPSFQSAEFDTQFVELNLEHVLQEHNKHDFNQDFEAAIAAALCCLMQEHSLAQQSFDTHHFIKQAYENPWYQNSLKEQQGEL